MKHFLPSSVMLTPFVVKYYASPEEDEDLEQLDEECVEQQPEEED
ncbi:hypothetical protein [Vibrio japonicus]|uniref:Uncharacterized protein n=1 Tax=Vibrio japonicus TaxID=1824638 RepID=A0ABY5LNR9_9VIBR|nr:hypothetical protein [Vibrio japonicus]UUM32742.1 hypothetical protein NP165_14345 [Vibrio japonicus]